MRRDIAKRWVRALRSGRYRQGTGVLCYRRDDGMHYCCLGVLCDLAEKSGVCKRNVKNGAVFYFDGADVSLPESVMKWADMSSLDGSYRSRPNATATDLDLAFDNDSRRLSFLQIANIIERHVDEL